MASRTAGLLESTRLCRPFVGPGLHSSAPLVCSALVVVVLLVVLRVKINEFQFERVKKMRAVHK